MCCDTSWSKPHSCSVNDHRSHATWVNSHKLKWKQCKLGSSSVWASQVKRVIAFFPTIFQKICLYFGAVVMSQVLCLSLKSRLEKNSTFNQSSALLYQTCWCWFPNMLTLPIIFCHFAFKQSSLCQWKSSKMFVLGISEIICCIAKKSNNLLSQENVGTGWLFFCFKKNNSLFFQIGRN